MAIGEDLVLSNRAALDLLSPNDVAVLRLLAAEDRPPGAAVTLALDSGRPVSVLVTPVSGSRRGVVLHVDVDAAPSPARGRTPPRVSAPVLVCGPPGSGRSTRATEIADRHPVTVLPATLAVAAGEGAWARAFEQAMDRRTGSVVVDGTVVAGGTVVVEDIDLLPDRLLDLVSARVPSRGRPQLVLTGPPVERLTGRAAALAGSAVRREVTLPLAARRSELPDLAARMLREIEPDARLQLMPGAVAALVAHSWPGNLTKLRAVLTHATQRRWGAAIAVKDLPDGYRTDVPDRPLPPLDQAQRDVIVATLRRHDGNKAQVARELGVSRTTLYARMRALRITTY